MNTALKSLVVASGLLGAGVLLAYGSHYPGGWGYGHHGPGFHGPGMGYRAALVQPGNIESRLATIKQDLAITPDQEAAWNAFSTKLTAHAESARALHDARWGNAASQAFTDHASAMATHWGQRAGVHQAAQDLISVLTDAQRLKADQLFGPRFRGMY